MKQVFVKKKLPLILKTNNYYLKNAKIFDGF